MKTKKQIIPVFFATNNSYAKIVDVAIISLIENASSDYNYNIHILYNDLSKENIEKLKKNSREGFNVITNDVKDFLEPFKNELPDEFYYTLSAYHRLFIEKLFPQYEKAIYLDCDVIIADDISKFYNIDVSDKLFGCINEQNCFLSPLFTSYIQNVVGIEPKKYFNSGVLLLNLKQIRRFRLLDKFIYLIKKYNFKSPMVDQDYLNILCRDKVLLLENGWNKENVISQPLEGELHIKHYALTQKPWLTEDVEEFDLFWKYAKKSCYYQELLEVFNSYKKCTQNDDEMLHGIVGMVMELLDSDYTFKKRIIDEGIIFDYEEVC